MVYPVNKVSKLSVSVENTSVSLLLVVKLSSMHDGNDATSTNVNMANNKLLIFGNIFTLINVKTYFFIAHQPTFTPSDKPQIFCFQN